MKMQPMLAGKAPVDLEAIKYPVLVSPKLDGIRALKIDGVMMSRNLKPIPNEHIQDELAHVPEGFDGELIVGAPTGGDVMGRTQSGVMARAGKPDFTYHVFDCLGHGVEGFHERLYHVSGILDELDQEVEWPVKIVPHKWARTAAELSELERHYVELGYEGIMIRDPKGGYKFGRSTVREGGLLKWKRWHDAEAVVLDVVEEFENTNEATKDELGRTKRSSAKAGKVGKNTLGALVCTMDRDTNAPIITTFELGTGFTAAQRQEIWSWDRGHLIGSLVKFKYQELTKDGVPRFPVFLGFRDPIDA